MGVPVETADGRLTAGGVTKIVTAEFVRLANATAYTALDVVGPNTANPVALPFPSCARFAGGTGIIYSALLIDSVDATTNPNFDLVLFDTRTLTVAGDNLISTITDDEATHCVAAITFNGTDSTNVATVGGNLIIKAINVGQAFKCADGSMNLWGVVIDRGGYTPASGERFTFKIAILQD